MKRRTVGKAGKIGELLRYYRFSKKLYTSDMAKLLGMRKTTYNDLECGKCQGISDVNMGKVIAWLLS